MKKTHGGLLGMLLIGSIMLHQPIAVISDEEKVKLNNTEAFNQQLKAGRLARKKLTQFHTIADVDVKDTVLSGLIWDNVTITGNRFENVVIKNGSFKQAVMDHSHFKNVVFENMVLDKVELLGSVLTDVTFINCQINKTIFNSSEIHGKLLIKNTRTDKAYFNYLETPLNVHLENVTGEKIGFLEMKPGTEIYVKGGSPVVIATGEISHVESSHTQGGLIKVYGVEKFIGSGRYERLIVGNASDVIIKDVKTRALVLDAAIKKALLSDVLCGRLVLTDMTIDNLTIRDSFWDIVSIRRAKFNKLDFEKNQIGEFHGETAHFSQLMFYKSHIQRVAKFKNDQVDFLHVANSTLSPHGEKLSIENLKINKMVRHDDYTDAMIREHSNGDDLMWLFN